MTPLKETLPLVSHPAQPLRASLLIGSAQIVEPPKPTLNLSQSRPPKNSLAKPLSEGFQKMCVLFEVDFVSLLRLMRVIHAAELVSVYVSAPAQL
jgi:hypothetical protein